MLEPVPVNAPWQFDSIEQYNLSEEIINNYLNTIWGNYKYFVEVSHERDRKLHGGTGA
jgi:hypothetical protein